MTTIWGQVLTLPTLLSDSFRFASGTLYNLLLSLYHTLLLVTFTADPSLLAMAESYGASGDLPSYASHRMSQQFDLNTPPLPPPKPNSQEVSRQGTPASAGQHLLPLETPRVFEQSPQSSEQAAAQAWSSQDPGPKWLPKILENKSYVCIV